MFGLTHCAPGEWGGGEDLKVFPIVAKSVDIPGSDGGVWSKESKTWETFLQMGGVVTGGARLWLVETIGGSIGWWWALFPDKCWKDCQFSNVFV